MPRLAIMACILYCLFPCTLAASDVRFRIMDSRDAPVSGATLRVLNPGNGSGTLAGLSDAEGRIALPLSRTSVIEVEATGFEPVSRKIEIPTNGNVILKLKPAVFRTSVEVLVRDTPGPDGSTQRNALEIERSGARTVYDAVDALIPGAHVPSRGILGHGLGISNSITLRGIGGSPTTELLVVVDGRPDVMGLMGHPIPDFYSLTDVGSLRITEGPASVLYGNRAMGGVIEIQPASLRPGFHTEFTSQLGSYYTGQDRLSHGGQLGRLQYLFSGGISHTSGHRENSAFRNQDGALHLSYGLNGAWKATVDGRYGHFTVEDPGTLQAPTPGSWARVGRGGYSIGLENRSEHSHGSVNFFSSYGHHMLSDGFRSVDDNIGFRLRQTFEIGSDFEIDVGGDASRYGGRAQNITVGNNFGEYFVSEGGGFGRMQWNASDRLSFNAGLRYDRNSVFGEVAATEFGTSYRFGRDHTLAISIAKGFRNPTIRELYLFPAPTPTLKPERIWNYQATFQLRPIPGLLAWVTGYYADVDNLIVATGMYPNLKLENIGRAANRGVELNGRLRLNRRIALYSGYAWFSSTNPAPYVPGNKLIVSLDADLTRAFLTVGATAVGRSRANNSGTVMLEGYLTAKLKCTVPLGRYWSVFAAVDNLFDRHFEELAGYPMPGITASGGFNARF